MKTNTVTTNVRIPKFQYIEAKNHATNLDMSFNTYITTLIDTDIKNTFFNKKTHKAPQKKKEKNFYQALIDLAKEPYTPKPLGASEDDKIIYDIKD